MKLPKIKRYRVICQSSCFQDFKLQGSHQIYEYLSFILEARFTCFYALVLRSSCLILYLLYRELQLASCIVYNFCLVLTISFKVLISKRLPFVVLLFCLLSFSLTRNISTDFTCYLRFLPQRKLLANYVFTLFVIVNGTYLLLISIFINSDLEDSNKSKSSNESKFKIRGHISIYRASEVVDVSLITTQFNTYFQIF